MGKDNFPKLFDELSKIYNNRQQQQPVILCFDNEQIEGSKKPLNKFMNIVDKDKKSVLKNFNLSSNLIGNLFLLTHPLPEGMNAAEMEDLFDRETLNYEVKGKKFDRKGTSETDTTYSKHIFSNTVYKNYEKINFEGFKPFLDELNKICSF